MKNNFLTKIIAIIKKNNYDGYYISISNENLYEYTDDIDNHLKLITGFTGDTGSMLILKDQVYLYVDGRFVIQAKNEISDKRIKIFEANSSKDKLTHMLEVLKPSSRLAFFAKNESTDRVLKAKELFSKKKIKVIPDYKIFKNEIKKEDKLFLLNSKYITKSSKRKIDSIFKMSGNDRFDYYITSSLEEIGYLTNIRRTVRKNDYDRVLADAFMVVGKKVSYVYANGVLEKKDIKKLYTSGIVLKNYNSFYDDLKKYKLKKYIIDPKLNNYYIYTKLGSIATKHFMTSPLIKSMSIKGKKEIDGLRKCNVLDGVAITKAIYYIKDLVRKGKKLNEYEAKCIVDDYRLKVGGKSYLTPSFQTIAAYKGNAAICHYVPSKEHSQNIKSNSILLIDSGGNYLFGTTDITRTISLCSDKKKISKIIKRNYTQVLNSLFLLAMQKFPKGLTGMELDILARQNLYNEYLDFGHSTGHGIGYVSNVHEGPCRIGPGYLKCSELNVLRANQVISDEPGLYFEGRYGIRIENDLLIRHSKDNDFGTFLEFEHLTLCPFDRDLIDEKILDRKIIKTLNEYNKIVYKKLYPYLDNSEQKRLLYDTKPFN